jgi:hypothetical protein
MTQIRDMDPSKFTVDVEDKDGTSIKSGSSNNNTEIPEWVIITLVVLTFILLYIFKSI